MSSHVLELRAGERYAFGANWARFLLHLTDQRIDGATRSLQVMLGVENLIGKRFLDAGSGSGLFSLAARRLGAAVLSFDYDPQSVACTAEVKRRYAVDDPDWTICEGSVLDASFLKALGRFDIVYSWGVLHHTGNLRQSLENIAELVAPSGHLFISIYNDQGWKSKYWRAVKRQYNRSRLMRALMIMLHLPYLIAPVLGRALVGRVHIARGMSLWHDCFDWLGGYPYEAAKPEEIFGFFRQRGMILERLTTTQGWGCNEFLFTRPPS